MNRATFDLLFLNIHAILEMTLENFYYKITEENGIKIVDYDYNKSNEKDWTHCTDVYGEYCGENYLPDGELNIVKIRVIHPFKMSKDYHSYIPILASSIVSIVVVDKKSTTPLDDFLHKLTKKDLFDS